jgi:hypothetical protein
VAAKGAIDAAAKVQEVEPSVEGVSGMMQNTIDPNYDRLSKIRQGIYRDSDNSRTPMDHLPPHIRSKKSWSDVFKVSVYQAEQREFYRKVDLIERLVHDDSFQGKARRAALRVFGIE